VFNGGRHVSALPQQFVPQAVGQHQAPLKQPVRHTLERMKQATNPVAKQAAQIAGPNGPSPQFGVQTLTTTTPHRVAAAVHPAQHPMQAG
jgi:hypothetical protein